MGHWGGGSSSRCQTGSTTSPSRLEFGRSRPESCALLNEIETITSKGLAPESTFWGDAEVNTGLNPAARVLRPQAARDLKVLRVLHL